MLKLISGAGRAAGMGAGQRLPSIPTRDLFADLQRGSWAFPDPDSERPVDFPQHKVLIADDFADTADSMACLLERSGCDVRTVTDGASAVDSAARFRPELILMDLHMPVLNGVEACKRIRDSRWGRNILIAAFTGISREAYARDCREAGFDCFLLKPVPFVAVRKLLSRLRCY